MGLSQDYHFGQQASERLRKYQSSKECLSLEPKQKLSGTKALFAELKPIPDSVFRYYFFVFTFSKRGLKIHLIEW